MPLPQSWWLSGWFWALGLTLFIAAIVPSLRRQVAALWVPFSTSRQRQATLSVVVGLVTLFGVWLGWAIRDMMTQTAAPNGSQVPRAAPRALIGWGSPGPFCAALIDGSPLMSFRDKYGVAIMCGMPDPTIDKFENKTITISSLFTIRAESFPVVVPHSKEMAEELKKRAAAAGEAAKVPQGTPVDILVTTWYEVVLLPQGTDVSVIQRLSDVARYGGKIVSQER